MLMDGITHSTESFFVKCVFFWIRSSAIQASRKRGGEKHARI